MSNRVRWAVHTAYTGEIRERKWQGNEENCKIRSFILVHITKYY
jgi:hypothetical protein